MVNAVLLRDVVIRVRDVSAGGCLFESPTLLTIGTVGQLDVELDGARRSEWFRVCRVQRLHEGRELYLCGVEFLPFAVAGGESLRGMVDRAWPGDTEGKAGLAGRSSSDPGNSVGLDSAGEAAAEAVPTKIARKVIEFPRRG